MAGKKDAAMKHMGEVEEKKSAPMKRHVHKIEIERGTNGGHVVHHEMRGGKEGEPTRTGPHVIANNDDLHDHVDEAMGDQPPAGEGMPPGQADAAAGLQDTGAGAGGDPMNGGQ